MELIEVPNIFYSSDFLIVIENFLFSLNKKMMILSFSAHMLYNRNS